MPTFTSKATGNWSSSGQTTWNEVGIPGTGDSVTIQSPHVVTVDVNTMVGDFTDTAVVINSGGEIDIASNINLTINGNIDNSGSLQLADGSNLFFNQLITELLSDTVSLTDSIALQGISTLQSNYNYFSILKIDHTQCGAADTSNYVAAVILTNSRLKTVANGGHVDNGNDLNFFSDAALTIALKYVVIHYDATTGNFIALVKVPTVSHTVDTPIYLAYGNSTVTTDQSDALNTFDTDHVSAISPSVASGTLTSIPDLLGSDPTNHHNNTGGFSGGHITGSPQGDVGPVYAAITFSGGNYANTNSGTSGFPSGSNPRAIAAWINLGGNTADGCALGIGDNIVDATRFTIYRFSNQWLIEGRNTNVIFGSVGSDSSWHHIVIALPSGQTTFGGCKAYIDGVPKAVSANATTVNTTNAEWDLAKIPGATAGILQCKLADIRIHQVARNDDWWLMDYNSQKPGTTFFSLSFEYTFQGFNKNFSDSLTLVDGIVLVLQKLFTFSDTITLADSLAITYANGIILQDTITLLDGLDYNVTFDKSVNDTITLTDVLVWALGIQKVLSDAASLDDSLTTNLAIIGFVNQTLSDLLVLNELLQTDLTGATLLNVSVGDAQILTDLIAFTVSVLAKPSDTITLSDLLMVSILIPVGAFNDTMSMSDSIRFNALLSKLLQDRLVLSDSLSLASPASNAYSDTVPLADSTKLVLTAQKIINDAIVMTDTASTALRSITPVNLTAGDALALTDSDRLLTINLEGEISYLREYLNDSLTIQTPDTPLPDTLDPGTPTSKSNYLRRYLNDVV